MKLGPYDRRQDARRLHHLLLELGADSRLISEPLLRNSREANLEKNHQFWIEFETRVPWRREFRNVDQAYYRMRTAPRELENQIPGKILIKREKQFLETRIIFNDR